MWMEIAVVSAVLCTRWMSPGGAKPLTSPTWFSLRPTRFKSVSNSSSCSTPWMTPNTQASPERPANRLITPVANSSPTSNARPQSVARGVTDPRLRRCAYRSGGRELEQCHSYDADGGHFTTDEEPGLIAGRRVSHKSDSRKPLQERT